VRGEKGTTITDNPESATGDAIGFH
jgi:hypothetical protein